MIACIARVVGEDREPQDEPQSLHVALLDIVPRVRIENDVIWLDVRGMPLRATLGRVTEALVQHGFSRAVIAVAEAPIVASVAARTMAIDRDTSNSLQRTSRSPSARSSSATPRIRVQYIEAGHERAFLDPMLVTVLDPDPSLANLLDGAGIEYCRDLSHLSRESIEVRFGADGVQLWRLSRGDDTRRVFDAIPRSLPEASMEWSEYAIKRVERLVFVLNGLCGSVCNTLQSTGEGAMAVTMRFSLANRTVYEHPLRAARPTSNPTVWMRIIRLELDELVLPDAVVGIALRVDALGPLGDKQGDLFDLGFTTARAAEAGLAQVLDDQGDIAVMPQNSRHSLMDRRTMWVPLDAAQAIEQRSSVAHAQAHAQPMLTLQILSRPTRVSVSTRDRRGDIIPVTYRDSSGTHTVLEVAGPDRVSGERWGQAYARDYYRCVTNDGQLVWLYHDALSEAWYMHGWWD